MEGLLLVEVPTESTQGRTQPISSSDEAGRGTPDRSHSPVMISSSTQRDLEVDLALRDSLTREGEPRFTIPNFSSQSTPSSPIGSLSGLG